uniref:Uncharacterized protein n=1 Tax=Magnetococcus massalia (strain MO-1) TaxID=451514 RepID=A0A1S7LIW6_MAGMO|nr:protein of unknown function [Candidatus Magnetococcus massalia]
MIEYMVKPELQLVIAEFIGDIPFDELLYWHLELAARDDYQAHYFGLADMRRANMLATPQEVAELDALNEEQQIVTGRWAVLVATPREAAMAAHYENLKGSKHPMRYFSTLQAAAEYLEFDLTGYLPEEV